MSLVQLAAAYRARRVSVEVGVYALAAAILLLAVGLGLFGTGSPLLAGPFVLVGLAGLVWQASGVWGAVREVYWDAS